MYRIRRFELEFIVKSSITGWLKLKLKIHFPFDRTAQFRLFVVMPRFKISRLYSYFHYTFFDFTILFQYSINPLYKQNK